MTRTTPLALSLLLALGLSGTAQAAGTLHLANWSDYFPPELLKKFEKDTGIKATLDAYDSNGRCWPSSRPVAAPATWWCRRTASSRSWPPTACCRSSTRPSCRT